MRILLTSVMQRKPNEELRGKSIWLTRAVEPVAVSVMVKMQSGLYTNEIRMWQNEPSFIELRV